MKRLDRSEAGFTLIELVVVVGVFAAILAIAAPSMQEYRRKAEYREAARMVANFLQQGRNQSIADGIAYTVTCTPTSSVCTVSTVKYDEPTYSFSGGEEVATYTFANSVVMKTGTADSCDQVTAIAVEYYPNGSAEIDPNPPGSFEVCVMTTDGAPRFIVKLESEATGKVSINRP